MSDRSESRWPAAAKRLRAALAETVRVNASLRANVADLSERYRAGSSVTANVSGPDEAMAYLAYRMPATFQATGAAMRATALVDPAFAPRSLLDVGAGPGTAGWAACTAWPTIGEATLVEREPSMIDLGRDLARRSGMSGLAGAEWVRADLRTWTGEQRDLVTVSYVLGELGAVAHRDLIHRLWQVTGGLLLIVEPGTPDGFERVRSARAQLIEADATVIAPCPHDAACPIVAPDWCHFSARLERSPVHRRAKEVELSYEDEPYSYVAASRNAVERTARVIARPASRKGAVSLRLCTDTGIVDRLVTRREGPAFKVARKLSWGSSVPAEVADTLIK